MTVRIDPLEYGEFTYEGEGETIDAAITAAVKARDVTRREFADVLDWTDHDLFLRVRAYEDGSYVVKAILR